MRPTPPDHRHPRPALLAASLALASLLAPGRASADDGPLEYNRDIRPILAENCFACHGPDSAARKADLRLDRREVAVEAGAVAPGKPDDSELIDRINSDDPKQVMPPKKTGKTLTAAEKDRLRRWIAAGAEYQPHWSLIAPKRPEPPPVKDAAWVRNPIDRFILARLEAEGLRPAPEADRRTLIRRLSLDLGGLPPTPEEVEAFVDDDRPDAYDRLVDRLMASPRWGEHRARYWLDAARYADTHGLHFDNFREMWSYRDWVIHAFNKNMPFDRFTVEQLAGDMLPGATLDQRVATGFGRCNITTNEGGTILEENLVLYNRDRTETFAQVFLGTTAGCAVCHDHKFDPLTQKEFYSLAAFFNNTTHGALDGNIKDTPPIAFVPDPQDRGRWDGLAAELAGVRQQVESRRASARPDFDRWLAALAPDAASAMTPTAGLELRAGLARRDADATAVEPDDRREAPLEVAHAGDFEKDRPFSFGAWVKAIKPGQVGAVVSRMDEGHDHRGWDLWVENGRVATHMISHWSDDAFKVSAELALKAGEWTHLFVSYDGSGKPAGVKIFVDGTPRPTRTDVDALKGTIRAQVPLKVGQRSAGGKLNQTLIHDLRIYDRALTDQEVERLVGGELAGGLLAKAADKRPAAEVDALFRWWLAAIDPPSRGLRERLAALEVEERAIKGRGTVAHVMQEKPGEPTAYVLFRGDYDKRREQVKADTPAMLPPLPTDLPHNRLGLAQWLLRPENPLTARVTVNRFWQEVFGAGLVRSTGDFGVSGELPSHPELLDWLAVDFRESGWDVQRFFRQVVTSASYRQAATASPEALEKDPGNRLLSRGPRFRIDGEMVRDYALAASGLLVEKVGGPSVRPYQPPGIWEAVAMPESNTRNYRRDDGASLYRRSLYTFWKRAAPPATMEIFNAPSRETCTVRRERTNTPLQALVTLNDEQFVEAARHLAQVVLRRDCGRDDDRIAFLAARVLGRPLRPEEAKVVRSSLDDLLAHYRAKADDAKKLLAVGASKADPTLDPPALAAWTMLANELLNLDEALNK
ncbi:MAG TPA: DUF1553 domain-containing protein [Isosphaeraceae bacterium]|jgi:mono/diheme cytochrome c family protein|nr:DUF1553 domain-containing protein [Isosphaeraceae bacterium]